MTSNKTRNAAKTRHSAGKTTLGNREHSHSSLLKLFLVRIHNQKVHLIATFSLGGFTVHKEISNRERETLHIT